MFSILVSLCLFHVKQSGTSGRQGQQKQLCHLSTHSLLCVHKVILRTILAASDELGIGKPSFLIFICLVPFLCCCGHVPDMCFFPSVNKEISDCSVLLCSIKRRSMLFLVVGSSAQLNKEHRVFPASQSLSLQANFTQLHSTSVDGIKSPVNNVSLASLCFSSCVQISFKNFLWWMDG